MLQWSPHQWLGWLRFPGLDDNVYLSNNSQEGSHLVHALLPSSITDIILEEHNKIKKNCDFSSFSVWVEIQIPINYIMINFQLDMVMRVKSQVINPEGRRYPTNHLIGLVTSSLAAGGGRGAVP